MKKEDVFDEFEDYLSTRISLLRSKKETCCANELIKAWYEYKECLKDYKELEKGLLL